MKIYLIHLYAPSLKLNLFTIEYNNLFETVYSIKQVFVYNRKRPCLLLIVLDLYIIFEVMNNSQARDIESLGRYFTYAAFESRFMHIVESLPQDLYSFSYLGSSVNDRSIYGLKLGHGDFKILAWSQMHGNESTTTRALLDFINLPDVKEYLDDISLYIIPVLNPDGAQEWTRYNANGIDLNRDATDRSQPESRILKEVIDLFQPNLALNMHGQRTIYGVVDSSLPCQLSFLSPAYNIQKSVNSSRAYSMAIINAIAKDLQSSGATLGRYDDTFNANCWGDYCQSIDIPTILFEAGHVGDDYSRQEVTNLMVKCLKITLRNCSMHIPQDISSIISQYEQIPPVSKNYVDILIRNFKGINTIDDLSVMYHEQPTPTGLEFVPMLYAINEKSISHGHREIDLNTYPGYEQDLIIGNDQVVSSKSLKISSFIK